MEKIIINKKKHKYEENKISFDKKELKQENRNSPRNRNLVH